MLSRNAGGAGPILIVDPELTSRALICGTLEKAGFLTIEAETGEEALETIRRTRPRLVVLEVCLPGLCGYEICHQLRDEFGDTLPILFVSDLRTESFDRVAGLLIGADDYLVEPFAPDELVARVRRLTVRAASADDGSISKLTRREREVLQLLADGLSQREIADRLFISRSTAGTHIEHIFTKLGVRSRAQAIALAYRTDFVSPQS